VPFPRRFVATPAGARRSRASRPWPADAELTPRSSVRVSLHLRIARAFPAAAWRRRGRAPLALVEALAR
jgi:hypothetical protein